MKKIISILLICLSISYSRAAINSSAYAVIATTADDTNGALFDPGVGTCGTDFSNQDGAQVTYVDAVLGTGGTSFTSVAHPITTNLKCNGVKFASSAGCTAGYYIITNAAAGVATLDRSAGTATSTCSAKTGGSAATLGVILSAAMNTAMTGGTAVAPFVVNLKAGTYTLTTQIAPSIATINQLIVRGFGTNPGDYAGQPVVTTATNSTILFNLGSSLTTQVYDNVKMTNTAGIRADCVRYNSNTNGLIIATNSVFDGCAIALNANNGAGTGAASISAYNTEIKNSTGEGISAWSAVYLGPGTWIHANGGNGASTNTGASIYVCNGAILSGNTGKGFIATSNATTVISNNCDYVSNTSDGLNISFSTTGNNNNIQAPLLNCNIFDSNGGWGVNNPSVTYNPAILGKNDAYRNNTSGTQTGFTAGQNQLGPSVSPFVSSTDFGLNATATGGPVLKRACNVGTLGGFTVYDVGAVQTTAGTPASAGGGFGYVSQ